MENLKVARALRRELASTNTHQLVRWPRRRHTHQVSRQERARPSPARVSAPDSFRMQQPLQGRDQLPRMATARHTPDLPPLWTSAPGVADKVAAPAGNHRNKVQRHPHLAVAISSNPPHATDEGSPWPPGGAHTTLTRQMEPTGCPARTRLGPDQQLRLAPRPIRLRERSASLPVATLETPWVMTRAHARSPHPEVQSG